MTDDNESDEPVEERNTSLQNVVDRGEVETATGRKICRVAVNELSFKDIIAEGCIRLEKKNLHGVRYRSFEREKGNGSWI